MSARDDESRELILLDRDLNNDLWLRITEHLERRLALLRQQNDGIRLTPEDTAVLRGRIAEVKHLLAAGKRQD